MNNRHKKSLFIKIMLPFVMLAFFTISAKGQINYVQNPSFEVYDTCPDNIGQIHRAIYWSSASADISDFMHTCANPNSIVGVPNNDNNHSYQYPKTGLGYARMFLFEKTSAIPTYFHSEYMKNMLNIKLKAGKNYCVKGYLSFNAGHISFIDGFGFYFDDGSYEPSMNVSAQVENPDYNYLIDSVGWIEISGNFIATGNEEYVTLGNFKKLQTHYIPTADDPNNGYYNSAYYIDDISVIESDLPAFAGNDTALQAIGDSLFLGRPPEIGLECTWYNWAGDSIGSGAGIWVKPTHTQPYIVEQNLCGNITRDTVYVSMGTSVENESIFEGLKVFPNPSEGCFTVWSNNLATFASLSVSISEISGKKLYQESFSAEESITIKTTLPAGVYLLQIQDTKTGAKAINRLLLQ